MAKEVFELEDTEFVFKYKGKEMTLREPTLPEGFALDKKMKECKEDAEKMYNANLDYLVKLGGDKEALQSMSLNNIIKVVEIVNGKKK